ncbi:hypothetical protein GEMRC1_010941 [Eukaryota sp. GEM-RC1]
MSGLKFHLKDVDPLTSSQLSNSINMLESYVDKLLKVQKDLSLAVHDIDSLEADLSDEDNFLSILRTRMSSIHPFELKLPPPPSITEGSSIPFLDLPSALINSMPDLKRVKKE